MAWEPKNQYSWSVASIGAFPSVAPDPPYESRIKALMCPAVLAHSPPESPPRRSWSLFFRRDNHGHEVDLFPERGTRLDAVEIKSAVTAGCGG